MNEKAYKTLGVISVISGAQLLKDRKGLTF